MGSGVWTWGRFHYSHVYTVETVLPCIRACLAAGLRELFFTMWKDDGAAVDFDPAAYYAALAAELGEWSDKDAGQAGDTAFGAQLARVLAAKGAFCDRLRAAYAAQDRAALETLAQTAVPALVAQVEALWQAHRRVWMAQNKAFGFEVQCVRYGGLILRLQEVAARIDEYLAGEVAEIAELTLPAGPLPEHFGRYRSVVTPSSIL